MSAPGFIKLDQDTHQLRVWDPKRRLSLPLVHHDGEGLGTQGAWVLGALLEQREDPRRELVAALKENPGWAEVPQAVGSGSFASSLMASSLPESSLKSIIRVLPGAVLDDALACALSSNRWISASRLWDRGARFLPDLDAYGVARWMLSPWQSWQVASQEEGDLATSHRKAACAGTDHASGENGALLSAQWRLAIHALGTWLPRFREAGVDWSGKCPVSLVSGADANPRPASVPFLLLALSSASRIPGNGAGVSWMRAWLHAAQEAGIDWDEPSSWHGPVAPLSLLVGDILAPHAALRREFDEMVLASQLAAAPARAPLRL